MKKTALRGPKSAKTSTSASSKLLSIGIDIGKDVFQIVGFDKDDAGLEAEAAQPPAHEVRTDSRFHADDAARQLLQLSILR